MAEGRFLLRYFTTTPMILSVLSGAWTPKLTLNKKMVCCCFGGEKILEPDLKPTQPSLSHKPSCTS